MREIIALALTGLLLSGCTSGGGINTGIRVAYVDTDGSVKIRPLMRPAQPDEIDASIPQTLCPECGR